jgi:hypothetical protein
VQKSHYPFASDAFNELLLGMNNLSLNVSNNVQVLFFFFLGEMFSSSSEADITA